MRAAHLSGHPGYFGRPLPDVRGMCKIKGTLYSGEPCKDMQKREHAVPNSTDALVECGKCDACRLCTLEHEIGSRCSYLGENQGGWKCQIYRWLLPGSDRLLPSSVSRPPWMLRLGEAEGPAHCPGAGMGPGQSDALPCATAHIRCHPNHKNSGL